MLMRASRGRTSSSTGCSERKHAIDRDEQQHDADDATSSDGPAANAARGARRARSAVSIAARGPRADAEGGANLDVFVARFEIDGGDRDDGRDGGVADEMLHVEPQARARILGDDDLRVADRQHVITVQLARARERPAVEAHARASARASANQSASRRSMRSAAPGRRAGHDDVRAFAADGSRAPNVRSPAGSRTRICAYAPRLVQLQLRSWRGLVTVVRRVRSVRRSSR